MSDLDDLKDLKAEVIVPPPPRPAREKIDNLVLNIKPQIPEDLREPGFIRKVKDLLALMLNERTTDYLIDILAAFLPGWLAWPVRKFLDILFPEKLLSATYWVLDGISD